MASPDTNYIINKVKVRFPCKPYPSQLTMMDKIIKCIDRRENSLLESPTGSGKSLALLCSSLAWLEAEKERIYKLEMARAMIIEDEVKCSCCGHHSTPVKEETINSLPSVSKVIWDSVSEGPVHTPANESYTIKPTDDTELEGQAGMKQGVPQQNSESSEDGDFQAPKKRYRTPGMQAAPKPKKQRQSNDVCDDLEDLAMNDNGSRNRPEWTVELAKPEKEGSSTCNNKEGINKLEENRKNTENEPKKVDDKGLSDEYAPQIFFGTRTHKQITQIVRELNKTTYNTTKMCILASREHMCIHPEVSESKNKTEDCRKSVEGREGKSCSYYSRVHLINSQEDLENYGFNKAWDIEELVSLGDQIRACPYYISREIMKDADIVFCPYNYLIDPIIRSQMNINLTNQIVILDEAHNIEDSSRDAASWSVTTQKLEEAMNDLDYFISWNIFAEQHRALHSVCANLRRWILENSDKLIDCDYEKSSKVWDGKEMMQALEELGFTAVTLPILVKHFLKVMNPKETLKLDFLRKERRRSMNAHTASVFEGLFMVLSFLLKNNYKFVSDYRVAIIKKVEMVPSSLALDKIHHILTQIFTKNVNVEEELKMFFRFFQPGGWRRKGAMEKKWVYSLNFWCLNPAVAFSEIGSQSRSVILTSGTLSPMSSFSSELGVKFPIQLEANHVVGRSQVWVSSLSVGPSGSTLNATYRFAETFSFQDELGNAIHNVCKVVPHGVLCFFPSYGMLDKMMKRWKTTGLWGQLTDIKRTFFEPRGGDKPDFKDTMDDFYNAIKISEEADCESGKGGALFLAVCRGKVSEGMDFTDNNARAVITVGIPFPNIKDTQVELKRKYNDQNCSANGLLNGSEWYEIQAFRALNQALGRCIRHKNDWGAILLIDERFGKSPKYKKGLSKWIRNKVVHHYNFDKVLTSLKEFTDARRENASVPGTPDQTLCRTPQKSTELDETISNLQSPATVLYDPCSTQSPNRTPKKPIDCIQTGRNLDLPAPIPRNHHLTKTPLNAPSGAEVENIPLNLHRLLFGASTPVQTALSSTNVQQAKSGGVNPPLVVRVLPPNFSVSPANLSIREGSVQLRHLQFQTPPVTLGSKQNETSQVKPVEGVQLKGNTVKLRDGNVLQRGEVIQDRPLGDARKVVAGDSLDGGLVLRDVREPVGSTKSQGQRKIPKRSLFCSQGIVVKKEEPSVQNREWLRNHSVVLPRENHGRRNQLAWKVVGQADVGKKTTAVTDAQPRVDTEATLSPESPELFVTPPSSFGSSDNAMEGVRPGEEEKENAKEATGTTEDRAESVVTNDNMDDLGQEKENATDELTGEDLKSGAAKNENKHEDTDDVKQENSCAVTSTLSASSPVSNKAKDLLDVIEDSEPYKDTSKDITWNLSCSCCDTTFLSGEQDGTKPLEEDIQSKSVLGNILGSLFSLNNWTRKKDSTIRTLSTSDSKQVQGCCSALSVSEGKQTRRECKLNSIYTEEESRCYVPLVCCRCQEMRKLRGRVNVVAVRAVICGSEISQGSSPVWFVRDRVRLQTSKEDLEPP